MEGDDSCRTLVLGDETAVDWRSTCLTIFCASPMITFFFGGTMTLGDGDRHTGDAGVMVSEVLDPIDDFCRLRGAKVVIAVGNEFAKLFLVHEDAEFSLAILLVLMVVAAPVAGSR